MLLKLFSLCGGCERMVIYRLFQGDNVAPCPFGTNAQKMNRIRSVSVRNAGELAFKIVRDGSQEMN